jgi:hypothetical protein
VPFFAAQLTHSENGFRFERAMIQALIGNDTVPFHLDVSMPLPEIAASFGRIDRIDEISVLVHCPSHVQKASLSSTYRATPKTAVGIVWSSTTHLMGNKVRTLFLLLSFLLLLVLHI